MTETVQLACDESGEGPLLVAVHGITEDRHSWDPVPLAAHFRVVRVDLRGHGDSPTAPSYDLLSLGDDVAAVVETVAPGEVPLLVGHSIGGVVVTAYAAQHPVRGVINVDQPLELTGLQAGVQAAEPMLRGDGFDEFIAGLFGSMYGGLDPREVQRLEALRSPQQDVVLGMWSALLDLDATELGAVVDRVAALPAGTPYLSLHGLDPGPEYAAWLQQKIPTAVVEIWADPPTHYPQLVAPARFVQRVRAFERTLPT